MSIDWEASGPLGRSDVKGRLRPRFDDLGLSVDSLSVRNVSVLICVQIVEVIAVVPKALDPQDKRHPQTLAKYRSSRLKLPLSL